MDLFLPGNSSSSASGMICELKLRHQGIQEALVQVFCYAMSLVDSLVSSRPLWLLTITGDKMNVFIIHVNELRKLKEAAWNYTSTSAPISVYSWNDFGLATSLQFTNAMGLLNVCQAMMTLKASFNSKIVSI
ncbi:hypothetical protein HMI54_010816 [Coelomomyces lativittatus]|nr:hypothetical protein HMI55_000581 [Coelomomyces lativittatus]KAJ1508157.1 hypothetical protein HMI56_007427 [Coelomomyces lativittatus]KAJ1516103.1 hypothetical protein HMI54_010816 [Coelomomyces lativittatus]